MTITVSSLPLASSPQQTDLVVIERGGVLYTSALSTAQAVGIVSATQLHAMIRAGNHPIPAGYAIAKEFDYYVCRPDYFHGNQKTHPDAYFLMGYGGEAADGSGDSSPPYSVYQGMASGADFSVQYLLDMNAGAPSAFLSKVSTGKLAYSYLPLDKVLTLHFRIHSAAAHSESINFGEFLNIDIDTSRYPLGTPTANSGSTGTPRPVSFPYDVYYHLFPRPFFGVIVSYQNGVKDMESIVEFSADYPASLLKYGSNIYHTFTARTSVGTIYPHHTLYSNHFYGLLPTFEAAGSDQFITAGKVICILTFEGSNGSPMHVPTFYGPLTFNNNFSYSSYIYIGGLVTPFSGTGVMYNSVGAAEDFPKNLVDSSQMTPLVEQFLTVEAWIYIDGVVGKTQPLYTRGYTDPVYTSTYIIQVAGGIKFGVKSNDGTEVNFLSQTTTVSVGWHHFAHSGYSMYVDGVDAINDIAYVESFACYGPAGIGYDFGILCSAVAANQMPVDNFRLTIGIRYPHGVTFTPPTTYTTVGTIPELA